MARHTQTERRLTQVHPVLADKVRAILADLEGHGWQPIVKEGYRTAAQQAQKVRDGFSKVHFSYHMAMRDGRPCALACDITDARYGWEIGQEHPFWRDLGSSARAHGCVWGGDWTHFKDVAHVQLLSNDKLAEVKTGWSPPDETA